MPQTLQTTQSAPPIPSPEAASTFLPLVYDELCRLARTRLRRAGLAAILAPAELVHEAYLRLAGSCSPAFENRRHFFFAASRAMHDIAVETVRRSATSKRGGDVTTVALDELQVPISKPTPGALDLHRSLEELGRENPHWARVLKLSYFVGLTHPEIGQVLGVSRATVERRCAHGRAWLRRELSSGGASPSPGLAAPSSHSSISSTGVEGIQRRISA